MIFIIFYNLNLIIICKISSFKKIKIFLYSYYSQLIFVIRLVILMQKASKGDNGEIKSNA